MVPFGTDLSGASGPGKEAGLFTPDKTNILDEEKRLIDKVFSIVDKDNSGAIDTKELEQMFQLFGVDTHFLKNAINRIMSNVDGDHDGMISPKEFYALLSQKFEPGDPK